MWAIFPSNKHTRAVIELMTATLPHQGSERVVAIVGGSLLEDAVETTLRERLLDNMGLVDSLLDFDCMSSEHFGQLAWQFKRVSGSSGLKVQAAIAC